MIITNIICHTVSCFQFPQSNVRTILEKVAKLVKEVASPKQLMAQYIYEDPDDSGHVKERVFR